MQIRFFILLAALSFLTASCVAKNVIKGEYFLGSGEYKSGIESLTRDLSASPDSHETNYYLGRCYLADDQPEQGLKYLQAAVALKPDKADYFFWQGVAYGANKLEQQERKSYETALKLDARHLKSRLYLAHTQLDAKEYKPALENYDQVLRWSPQEASALFNRAFILGKLRRTAEAKTAWKDYLDIYLTGAFASRAVKNLNRLGDFSFRNHLIGGRTVALSEIVFKPNTTEIAGNSKLSLSHLGRILTKSEKVSIHIVAYQKNNAQLAQKKAKAVKKYLLKMFPSIDFSRLKVSWFGTSEIIKMKKKAYEKDESIKFITAT